MSLTLRSGTTSRCLSHFSSRNVLSGRQQPARRLIVPAQRCTVTVRASSQAPEPSEIYSELTQAVDSLHNLLYTIAASDAVASSGSSGKSGPFDVLANALETTLKFYQDNLDKVHVPYSYGWSIVLLTLSVKLLTFPLVKQQVESNLAVQNLKPRVEEIKARYGDDEARIKSETSILYEKAQVNPLAGCLPTLATIPIFIGLYRSLSNAAEEGVFNNQGFFWIPSLAGPTSMAARQAGTGTAWLFPLVDGHPPIGWEDATNYLILPVLLVAMQFYSQSILSPPVDKDNEQAQTMSKVVKFLPLMIGWFSLNVPSGLSLYYFSNTVLTTAQQVFLRKLGGAQVEEVDLGPIKNLGSARRNGEPLSPEEVDAYLSKGALALSSSSVAKGDSTGASQEAADQLQVELLQRRSKRKRTVLPESLVAGRERQAEAAAMAATASKLEDEFPAAF